VEEKQGYTSEHIYITSLYCVLALLNIGVDRGPSLPNF